jgi:hypothetical protein
MISSAYKFLKKNQCKKNVRFRFNKICKNVHLRLVFDPGTLTFLNAAQFLMGAGVYKVFTTILP